MALICENGSIVAGAETYVSSADCTQYHANRGNTSWAGTDAVKEAALRKATAYIDGKYRSRWKGQKVYPIDQPLEWPRIGVKVTDGPQQYYDVPPSFYDTEYAGFLAITTIPQRLKDATCEAALRALSGDLAIDADNSLARKKIDALEWEYRQGAVPGQKTYQIIDQLLSDYLKPLGSCDVLRG